MHELNLWELRLTKLVDEAVKKESWEEASKFKREREIVRFQILQVRPILNTV